MDAVTSLIVDRNFSVVTFKRLFIPSPSLHLNYVKLIMLEVILLLNYVLPNFSYLTSHDLTQPNQLPMYNTYH